MTEDDIRGYFQLLYPSVVCLLVPCIYGVKHAKHRWLFRIKKSALLFLFSLVITLALGPYIWNEPTLTFLLRSSAIAALSAVGFLLMTWAYEKAISNRGH